MRRAGKRIGEAILFHRQVNVSVKFLPFVDGNLQEFESSPPNIAFGNPTKFIAARNNGGPLQLYPKALLKQNVGDIHDQYLNGYDIEMYFDSLQKWSFGAIPQVIPPDAYSIESKI